ncbi:spermatogenesis-associated protein 31D1 [Acomys russatus]|uniref:spermatogenesis-associated protein 31D1 n=1 Tax=Acomys russatus TaxID=60746 RepID=UPI0021E1DDAD|nr:spermatogenesis-associated protein 31D1 [Acomys russatus]
MENILSSLNSLTETWLTLGSASCHIGLTCSFLSGLGLLLLYLGYLTLKVGLQSLWKKKHTPQPQGRIERKRRKLLKGGETDQRGPKDRRRLQTSLQSPDKSHDATGLQQLLCPDPLCSVCNKANAQVSCLLSQAPLEDRVALVSHSPSTASATETSLTLSSHLPEYGPGRPVPEALPQPSPPCLSILSPSHVTPSPIPPNASPPPTAIAPFTHIPGRPLTTFPPPLPHATQEAQLVLQAGVPNALGESPRELSPVPTAKGTVCKTQDVPTSAQPWSSAEEQQPLTKLVYSIDQQPLDSYASQGSSQRLTRTHAVQLRDRSSPNPDVLALFKRQEKRETDFTASEHKKEKTELFSMALNTSGKISASTADPKNSEVSRLLGNEKGKPGDPHLYHESSLPKNSEDQSEIKGIQCFWGLPSLHSESLRPEAAVSGNSYSERASFNRMAKAATGDESPTLPHPTPLPLPASDHQVWLQTLPQSQTKPDPPAKSEAQTQPLIQALAPSPRSQLRICGVRFHKPQEEVQLLGPSEIQQLEYNLLQKALESFLGLPTLSQRSQESFCHPPPKISSTRKSSKVHGPRLILPGDFPLTTDLQRKLEHHLRKRLIQHLWGLPQRIRDSLSLISPHVQAPEAPEAEHSRGLSWISLYKLNASRNPSSSGLSPSESFLRNPSVIYPLRAKGVKVQGHCPRADPDHLQSNSSGATESEGHSDSTTDSKCQPREMSGKKSKASWAKQCKKEREISMQEHMDRTKEMSVGQLLGAVEKPQYSTNVAQPPPETTPKQMKGEEGRLKNHQHGLSLSPSKKKTLEEHIKAFGRRMTFGLPQRVEESLESYMTKVEPSRPFFQSHVPSHTMAGLDSDQSSRFLPRNTRGDRLGTESFIPIQEVPLPATLPVGQTQPASENKKVSLAPSGREPIQPWTPALVEKGSLHQSRPSNRHGPEQPRSPGVPTDGRLAFSTNIQEPREERKSWEDGPMAEGSTQLLKGEAVPGLHPQSTKILTATQGTCSPGSHVAACQSLQEMSAPHNSETSDSKGGMLNSEKWLHIKAPGLPALLFASEEMTSKTQGPSIGDNMTASQVLPVHLPTVGVSMEPPQGSWVPAYVSGTCQNEECSLAARGVSPLATEGEKLGGGDAVSLGAPQTREESHSVQARAAEETQGHTCSPALSPKRLPPENQLTSQVKCFFLQRLSPGRKHKEMERSLAKGSSPLMSVKGTGLLKGRIEFHGNTEAQKGVRDPGVVLRKQLGHRHGTVIPVSPLMGSKEAQQEAQLQAQAEPVLRLPHSCCQASCSQVQRAESCSPGQGQAAPERCGMAGEATMVDTCPMHAPQGTRVPPKSYL